MRVLRVIWHDSFFIMVNIHKLVLVPLEEWTKIQQMNGKVVKDNKVINVNAPSQQPAAAAAVTPTVQKEVSPHPQWDVVKSRPMGQVAEMRMKEMMGAGNRCGTKKKKTVVTPAEENRNQMRTRKSIPLEHFTEKYRAQAAQLLGLWKD